MSEFINKVLIDKTELQEIQNLKEKNELQEIEIKNLKEKIKNLEKVIKKRNDSDAILILEHFGNCESDRNSRGATARNRRPRGRRGDSRSRSFPRAGLHCR